ncbi:MAG: hypothetical protein AAGF31_11310 [Planctomycetota bacterium]
MLIRRLLATNDNTLCQTWIAFAALAAVVGLTPTANGQVFDPGPSDPSLFDLVINLPPASNFGNFASIGGIEGETTQLNLLDGGSLGFSFDADSGAEVNVFGGNVREDFSALDNSEVNISGGQFAGGFDARSGSLVNISGGDVGDSLRAHDGSRVNVSGGSIGVGFWALGGSDVNITAGSIGFSMSTYPGSSVTISGGTIANGFDVRTDSVVRISGGMIGSDFTTASGSEVELAGGEFKLNGVAYVAPQVSLRFGDVFTGTLADGSAFIFSWYSGDRLARVALTEATLPQRETLPRIVATDVSNEPAGVRENESLTVIPGGILGDNFAAVDATLNIDGGIVGNGLETTRSIINISDGTVGSGFYALPGSIINLSGGTIGEEFEAYASSEINVSGGMIEDSFTAFADSRVNISGGTIGDSFLLTSGGEVQISGGVIGNAFAAFGGSVVGIAGKEFAIDGVGLNDLTPDDPFVVDDRDVTLSGLLADGTPFAFDLNRSFALDQDHFHPAALLTLTLVPEPATGTLVLAGVCASLSPRRRRD